MLIRGRIRTPGAREHLVGRPALVRRLMRARDSALTLIVAPPGYGKSTLLAQWDERDPRKFIALKLDRLDASDAAAAVSSLAGLLTELGEQPTVLVLDDAHLIDPEVLRAALDLLLPALSADCTVAVAARSEPRLPIGSLRARGLLTEIRGADLALTPAEAAALLRKAGVTLEFEAVQELVRRTEGWPAGLYLAALSLRDQADTADALDRFDGADYRLTEYFRDEVLSATRPDLIKFCARTAVLDELSGPVCDAVLQTDGSAATLIELARLNPFLVPLDATHDHFRWHPLFREALAAQLRRENPQLSSYLHRRASGWFDAEGDVDRAIDHAVTAGDAARAGELLWSNIGVYFGTGRGEIVERWVGRFCTTEVSERAPLALSAAYAALMGGRTDQARHWSIVAAAARERSEPEFVDLDLRPGVDAIAALLARSASEMLEAAQRALENEPVGGTLRPLCLFTRGVAQHLAGDRPAARESLEAAVDLGRMGAPLLAALSLAQLAMIALELRDLEAATELADQIEDELEGHDLADVAPAALAFAACAAVRARSGRSDEAKRNLRNGTELLSELGDFIPWYGAETRILLAHACLGLADIAGARTLLAEASRLARRTSGATTFSIWFDEAWNQMDGLAETSLAGPSSLTIAELRVLRFLPSHRSFREIAGQLGVSANTVKTQAHAIYRKLGVASRSEAVTRASDAGLLGQ